MLRSRPTTSIPEGEGITKINERKVRKKRGNQRKRQRGLSPLSCILVFVMAATVCVISYQKLSSNNHSPPREAQKNRLRKTSIEIEHDDGNSMVRHEMKLPTLSLYNLEYPSIDGELISLSRFAGYPSIVINVASQ